VPASLSQALQWEQLELRPGSYVDERLAHLESDLLFRVPFQGLDLFLYCLFEHQSQVDKWMLLRLLSYMVEIWQELLKANPRLERLPPIVPVVLYQGPSRWTVSTRLLDRLDLPGPLAAELRRYQPAFEHLLIDLSQVKTEDLKGDLLGRLGLGLMKAAAEDRLEKWLEQGAPLLAELLQQEHVPGIVETLLRYLMAADSSLDLEQVSRAISSAQNDEIKNRIMSLAEKLIEKGRQEGIHAGALVGEIRTLQRVMGLPISSPEELSGKPEEELDRLAGELQQRLTGTGS